MALIGTKTCETIPDFGHKLLQPIKKSPFTTTLPFEAEFHLHENEPVGGTHFEVNSFARRLGGKRQSGNGLLSVDEWHSKGEANLSLPKLI